MVPCSMQAAWPLALGGSQLAEGPKAWALFEPEFWTLVIEDARGVPAMLLSRWREQKPAQPSVAELKEALAAMKRASHAWEAGGQGRAGESWKVSAPASWQRPLAAAFIKAGLPAPFGLKPKLAAR